MTRICPYCGVKIEGIAENADYCPACNKKLTPKRTEEDIAAESQKIDEKRNLLLILGIVGVFFGFMLLLPDVILYFIIEPAGSFLIFWPINVIMIILGILLLIIRYPYSKKHKEISRVFKQVEEEKLICEYCGSKNDPGFKKCTVCGAPSSAENDND